jgi:hypothetical protein
MLFSFAIEGFLGWWEVWADGWVCGMGEGKGGVKGL